MSEWRDLKDAPKDGSEVLVCYKFGKQQEQIVSHAVVLWDICHEKWRITHDCCIPKSAIIGWMPLPEPPKKKHLCEDDYLKCVYSHNENGFIIFVKKNLPNSFFFQSLGLYKSCPICGESCGK